MASDLDFRAKDFPQLRALDRQDAERLLDEAIEAQRLDDQVTTYNNFIAGRGIVLSVLLMIAIPTVILLPPLLDPQEKFTRYLWLLPFVLMPVLLPFGGKTRRRRRLRPYIAAALAKNRTPAAS